VGKAALIEPGEAARCSPAGQATGRRRQLATRRCLPNPAAWFENFPTWRRGGRMVPSVSVQPLE
jgi:hypothetical protein